MMLTSLHRAQGTAETEPQSQHDPIFQSAFDAAFAH